MMTKVLVVEDTPLNLELVLEILDEQGFTADRAEDGEEAIKKTEKQVYDLILMDIALPGMDGVDAATIIKQRPEYKKVPVVALTAFAMKGDKERLLDAGFDDYISKPIDVPEFIRKIQKYKGAT
ncbi:MAG: response regulator [Candidatus Methanoperedens sp.]|nr:response regulator [Candidatus Methanoperedens sp.]MCZ7371440.1 response regulator [Candidatus Methanoperedens sp.]